MEAKNERKDVLNRFVEFREHLGMSWNAFSSSIGMRQTTISNQILGLRSLSLDTILSTLSAYEELSAEWLLRGHGNMFLEAKDEEPEEPKADNRLEALIDTITLLQETIKMKNATIDALQAELSQYKHKAKKA